MRVYRPSNGTTGACFEAEFCDRCVHEDHRSEKWCDIHTRAIHFGVDEPEYPRDAWVYLGGSPTCLAFRERGSGPTNDELPPVDPAQIDLFEEDVVTA